MKTVPLTKPLKAGKTLVESFRFREPRFEDYMLLGDPRAPIVRGDKVFYRPIPETVKDYAERLLIAGDPNIMADACLRDALAIEEAIIGFFTDAESPEKEKTISSGSPDSSPSEPAKDSATLAA